MALCDLKQILSNISSNQGSRKVTGISLAPGDKWPLQRVVETEFKDCDFRLMQMGGLLSKPRFESCVFRQVRFGGGRWLGARFSGCEFEGSNVEDSALSFWKNCVFEDCRWSQSKIATSNLEGCVFSKMDLVSVVLDQFCVRNSIFSTVTLTGDLQTVLFDKCEFKNFDFSATKFRELTFLDAEIDGDFIGPLNDENILVFDLKDLEKWVSAVEGEMGSKTASLLQRDLDFLRSTGRPICIDLRSFEELPESSRRLVVAIGKSVATIGATH